MVFAYVYGLMCIQQFNAKTQRRKDAGRRGEIALFAEHAPREGNIF
jgi:hypothetical protein